MTTLRPIDFKVSDKAAQIWTEDPSDLAFLHAVFTQCSLPYRNQGEAPTYVRDNGNTSLLLTGGYYIDPKTRQAVYAGLPYGSKPRLVLLHACTEAVKRRHPEIPVGDSLTGYLRNDLKANTDGRTLNGYKEQLRRLARASVTFQFEKEGNRTVLQDAKPFSRLELWGEGPDNQAELWPSYVTLGAEFFESLNEHAMPLDQRAVAALQHNARALDLYVWLAHRLHRVRQAKGQFVSWEAMAMQFGGDMKVDNRNQLKSFSRELVRCLSQAMQVYPKARIEKVRGGLRLHNSPTPVRTISATVTKLSGFVSKSEDNGSDR